MAGLISTAAKVEESLLVVRSDGCQQVTIKGSTNPLIVSMFFLGPPIAVLLLLSFTSSEVNAFLLATKNQNPRRLYQNHIAASTNKRWIKTVSMSSCCPKAPSPAAATAAAAASVTTEAVSHEDVSLYYGTTLSETKDLQTNACTTASAPPPHIRALLRNIHPDVIAKYYGCGLTIPDLLEGMTVLDLGCGSGRDVYLAAQLVGSKGRVIGVDMTPEQLNVATGTQKWHTEKFGYENTQFIRGNIERLEELDIEPNSVDIIISNCVINLCLNKEAVLAGCYRLLKPGGELYFSDVYSSARVPKSLAQDKVLWGECISGALYWNDFHNLSKKAGFLDPRLVEDSLITIQNKAIEQKVKSYSPKLQFFSATYRLFKLDSLEPHCEDYGQAVIYKGTMERCEGAFVLDSHHFMETGKVFPVCGNTWRMLHDTRFKDHFTFIGNFDRHYGIFEGCGTSLPYESAKENGSAACSPSGGGCC
jgi:arsenite methyltransferase